MDQFLCVFNAAGESLMMFVLLQYSSCIEIAHHEYYDLHSSLHCIIPANECAANPGLKQWSCNISTVLTLSSQLICHSDPDEL